MYTDKMISEQNLKESSTFVSFSLHIITLFLFCVKRKEKWRQLLPPPVYLSLAEGLAVGALVHGRIGLVGTHQDLIQRAVVLILAMICAGLDGAFNTLVCMAVHS